MTGRPLLLDLFCGAGGAAVGYHRAGFDVLGVDIEPQPRYPFEFVRGDALGFLLELGGQPFDAIHASPPCQRYSAMSACQDRDSYPDLLGPTRELLQEAGLPWVIENVEGAPMLSQPSLDGGWGITLCGHMFGLRLYRHRLFEANFPLTEPFHPRHLTPGSKRGWWTPGTIISVGGDGGPGAAEAREAMGIDWMRRTELAEAIPPAYTEFVGAALLDQLVAA